MRLIVIILAFTLSVWAIDTVCPYDKGGLIDTWKDLYDIKLRDHTCKRATIYRCAVCGHLFVACSTPENPDSVKIYLYK